MDRKFGVIFVLVFCLTVVYALSPIWDDLASPNGSLFENDSAESVLGGNESLSAPAVISEVVVKVVSLVVDSSRILIDGFFGVSATLVNENDSPVVGRNVEFYVDESKVGENVSDELGVSSVVFNGSGYLVGNHSVRVSGEGFVGGSSVVLSSSASNRHDPASPDDSGEPEAGEKEINESTGKEMIVEEKNESLIVASNESEIVESSKNESVESNATESLEEVRNFDESDILDRGPDYNIYRGENGSRVARVSPGAINYLFPRDDSGEPASGEEYLPINTTIVNSDCEFDWCVRAGVYWADFKEDSGSDNIVRFLFNGSYISYTPLDLRFVSGDKGEVIAGVGGVGGEASGNEFIYEDVYGEGLSLGYEYHNSFLKENLVIESLDDLPEPRMKDAYLSLDFVFDSRAITKESGDKNQGVGNREIEASDELVETEVFLRGEVLEEVGFIGKMFGKDAERVSKKDLKWDKSGRLSVKGEALFNKSDGGFAFRLPTPYAVDANGSMLELEYVFVERDGESVVSVLTPWDWLADEGRVFPVQVDPSTGNEYEDDYGECYYSSVSGSYTCLTDFGSDLEMGRYNDGGYYYLTRSFILWDFSSSFRNLLKEASVGLGTAVFDVVSRSGTYPWMYIHEVSDSYEFDSPSPGSESQSLFNGLDNNLEDSYYNPSYTTFPIDLDESSLESAINSNDDWIMGFVGYEGSSGGRVWIDKDASLWVSYTCDVDDDICNQHCHLDNGVDCDCYGECTGGWCYGTSYGNYECSDTGCADEGDYAPESYNCCPGLSWNSGTEECYDSCTETSGCDSCLSKSNGVDCDCASECSASYCNGASSGDYDCSTSCADDGEYAPSSGDCCNDWNSGTEQCYTDTSCGYPDGSSFAAGCDCDVDGDCDAGDYCEQGSGADACVEVPTCSNGKINVLVQKSNGEEISGTEIYLEGVSQGSTNSDGGVDGFLEVGVGSVDCGSSQEIEVKCSAGGTSCDVQSTSIDENNDLDSLYFSCDVCSSDSDLSVDSSSISFVNSGNLIDVSVAVQAVGISASNVKVELKCESEGSFEFEEYISSISSNGEYVVNFSDKDLGDCLKVGAYVDLNGLVSEDDEDNNYVSEFVIDPLDVYLVVDSGSPSVDEVIEDFVGEYVEIVSQGEAQVEVYVGRRLASDYDGDGALRGKLIEYKGEREGVPYNGIVAREGNKVYVYGNQIDGTLAAVRRLVEERKDYLNERDYDGDMVNYLSEEDFGAISVFDYLHTDENQAKYRQNNVEFAEIADKVLRKETFNLAIKRVKTANDGTVLRMKNVNYEMSPNLRSFGSGDDSTPVVIAGGIWSNLFKHEKLGNRLAWGLEIGTRDAWLIELTGGPNTECNNCPNYYMDNLTDDYFPSYIAGVQANTGEEQIDFVGFSNGCGVGLRSLDKYQDEGKPLAGEYLNETGNWVPMSMGNNSTRKFVGIGCPGAFEGDSLFKSCIDSHGSDALKYFEGEGVSHITKKALGRKLIAESKTFGIPFDLSCYLLGLSFNKEENDNTISVNLIESYLDIIQNESDYQPGNFEVSGGGIIYGTDGFLDWDDDHVVTANDNIQIANSLNIESFAFSRDHPDLTKGLPEIYTKVLEVLNEN